MTLPRPIVENAAFWHDAVCLECGNIQTPTRAGLELECFSCGSAKVVLAEFLLECADFIEKPEE